ncbi:AlpA family transcriptional regulator [Photobacterium sp. GB-50]|uniref:AlpA family transcriptional regulator n=1 Tax=Photobacterium sp. GB-50 TaxID=2022107 RepID=UPI000D163804|nr:AlpA family transcriptional regulator [Photobacterium sp. GB-50]PSW69480.1 AlpA family transcriptional regulator [Photobacterium sp. GB-50]
MITNRKPKKILRLPEVKDKVGLSRSSIYALMTKGDFPPSIPLGERSVGWFEDKIDQWLLEREKKRKNK